MAFSLGDLRMCIQQEKRNNGPKISVVFFFSLKDKTCFTFRTLLLLYFPPQVAISDKTHAVITKVEPS